MRLSIFLALALSGCGAAAPAAPETTGLRTRPRAGARYDVVVVVDAHIPALAGRWRSVSHGELEVVASDEGGTTMRSTESLSRLETPDNEVRLPPLVRESHCTVELRAGPHGDLLGEPTLEGTDCTALGHVASAVVAILPETSARVGDTWPLRRALAIPGGANANLAPAGEVTFAALDGGSATLSWDARADSGVLDWPGGTLRLRSEQHAETLVALSDGLARRGSSRTEVTYETTGDASVHFLPERVEVTWCLAAEGEAPCEVPAVAGGDRPAAAVYEGTACDERIARFDATVGAFHPALVALGVGDVETVDHGTSPLPTTPEPVVRVGPDGVRLDGRAVDVAQLLEELATLERNWGVLHPGTTFPPRVILQLAPATSLASVEPVLTAVLPIRTVDLVVATGEPRSPPAMPTWAGPGPTDPGSLYTYRSRVVSAAVRGCPPAIAALSASSAMDAAARADAVRGAVVEALRECRCGGVDVDTLEAALLDDEPAVSAASLVIPSGDTGTPLTLRRSGTTADLVRALADRSTPGAPVRFRWRP